MSSGGMFQLINSDELAVYKLIRESSGNGGYQNKVVIVKPILTSYTESPATIFIILDNGKLEEAMRNLTWTDNGIMVVSDSHDEFLSTGSDEKLPDYLLQKNLEKEKHIFYGEYGGRQAAITYVKSDINDWNYISVIPSKTYLEKVQYLKTIIYIYIGLCLIIGILISLYLTKRNYNPIKNLIQVYVKNLGKPIEMGNNEFSYLEKGFRDLLSEKEKYLDKIERQAGVMRDNAVSRLLKGRTSGAVSAAESLAASSITFSSNRFAVMVFNIEELGSMFADAVSDEKSMDLVCFVIRNVVEELASERHHGYAVEIGGMMACLVNISENGSENVSLMDDMNQIMVGARNSILENLKIDLSVSVSEIHDTIAGIEDAYSEAVEAMEYKSLSGDPERIIRYGNIKRSDTINASDGYHKAITSQST
jgi:hypothetical protein